jgi:hypothetical protein
MPTLDWIGKKAVAGHHREVPFHLLKTNQARFGDVGVNANYLSHTSNSVISSSLAIRFTDDVVIPRNRATDAPVYPNFRTAT